MTNPYADYEKTGYKRLLDLAKTLCRLVQQWEVVIRAKFSDNLAIMALLEAVLQLCVLLPAADAEYQALTLVVTPPEDTSETTPGYDPSADEPLPPDYIPA